MCKSEVSATRKVEEYGEYKLYGCPGCGNGFWHPLAAPTGDWYANAEKESNETMSDVYAKLHTTRIVLAPTHRNFFRRIPQKGGQLLDVGCGNGSFLKEASKGYEVYGLDFDSKSVEAAHKIGLENVFALSLADFAKERKGNRFDAITFFEVLEHQANPDSFLNEVRSLLKSSGSIAGSVPGHNKVAPFCEGDKPPNHFLLFTPAGLKTYLESQGFKDVLVEEIYGEDQVRFSLGINAARLRSAMGVSDSGASRNSAKYAAYSLAKKVGTVFLPVLNLASGIFLAAVGKGRKAQLEQDVIVKSLYFQARLRP